MGNLLSGLHHVTAFAKDPRENLEFCGGRLGLRLVKRTVNFDDPLVYHLYFGDDAGSPGTLYTTFPSPLMKRGVHGAPEARDTIFAVSAGTLDAAAVTLRERDIDTHEGLWLDRRCQWFQDGEGAAFGLVEDAPAAALSSGDEHRGGPISAILGVTLRVTDVDAAASFLVEALGFREVGVGERDAGDGPEEAVEFALGEARTALLGPGSGERCVFGAGVTHHVAGCGEGGVVGAGGTHHVAWCCEGDEDQLDVRDRVHAAGVDATPVLDRQYFRSIYFRIPGGVIFEVATRGPGFATDEPAEKLGGSLKLPPQHERRRTEIERHLVALD